MKWIVLFSLCFSIFGDSLKIFKSPLNFNSSITINNERGVVSSGDIFYRNGNFIYSLKLPSDQIIASDKENI